MPIVSLIKQADYELTTLRDSVEKLLSPFGGMQNFVKRGDAVLLKLNLVCPVKNSILPYTQAEIFQVIAEMALACGGKVVAGDSPGIGSAHHVARLAGITPIAEKLGVPIIEFTGVEVFNENRVFKKLTLAREILEATTVINLPRLKTHGQMILSAAVKNLFGAVLGTEKFAWHYRAGTDYLLFARMLHEIYQAIKPQLHLVDAIISMHGLGPTAGHECHSGFLSASTDAVALDATLMQILGKTPTALYTIQAANLAGDTAWQETQIVGVENLAELKPPKWHWAKTHALTMIDAKWWRYLPFVNEEKFRQWMAVYPSAITKQCVKCGACVKVCSPQAITLDKKLTVDTHKCIRCYCCHELCPQHAIRLKGGWFSKLIKLGQYWWR